jgi:hypothetical protein
VHEGDIGEPYGDATPFSDGKGIGVEVDTDDATGRPDELSHQEADVTHPTTHVEDTHPRVDTGGAKDAFRQGS